MFCSRCGKEVPPGALACPACGASVRATTPAQALAAGDVREADLLREAIGAEYELLDELGRGGMAIVYRARETALGREVAIKVLPFGLAFDQEFVERFEREARTAAQLEHPNIIPIYRVGKAGRVPYFVMKFLRGGSLAGRLGAGKRVPAADVRRMLVEAGKALGFAAKRGVVHRDIKPDNIMYDDEGNSVVTDFGIAKAMSGRRLTGTGMSIGTPHYMSPEQARAQPIDGRSDIYALGIVAYEALAGRVPFDGEDSFAIGYKHITEPLPEPVLTGPEERRVFDVIRRMTEKDPARRFQTAEELIDALEGRPALAPLPAEPERVAPPTAPLPAADRVRRPVARRGGPPERRGGRGVWLGLLGLVAVAGTAAGWYFVAGPGGQPAVAGQPAPVPAATDSGPAPASPRDPPASAVVVPPPADSLRPAGGPAGFVRVRGNFPQGTLVTFDGQIASASVTELPSGPRAVGITAPGHVFFTDTIVVLAGDTLEYEPLLTRLGSTPGPRRRAPAPDTAAAPPAALVPTCDDPTNAGYNLNGACYDSRPIPAAEDPFVPVPVGVQGTPRASVLYVRVGADGRAAETRPRNPSDDPAFERAAREFALSIPWRPATKAGAPVAGWTQWTFPPRAPQ
ncbi:MAG TPA: protein kinase [Gemmatimonadales bacterium]|nr:protein kinase [Gemmatimonadales bacterium]